MTSVLGLSCLRCRLSKLVKSKGAVTRTTTTRTATASRATATRTSMTQIATAARATTTTTTIAVRTDILLSRECIAKTTKQLFAT